MDLVCCNIILTQHPAPVEGTNIRAFQHSIGSGATL